MTENKKKETPAMSENAKEKKPGRPPRDPNAPTLSQELTAAEERGGRFAEMARAAREAFAKADANREVGRGLLTRIRRAVKALEGT